ncbi:hypothetical protein J3Q64DRAFT_1739967 [Phycomyces blakesleeanus]|uniref:Uncharacterized protein n=1 Tax=Phycomyces blakesleeanus TaxID=4837 RepID=A0ABR3B107_PHYBL
MVSLMYKTVNSLYVYMLLFFETNIFLNCLSRNTADINCIKCVLIPFFFGYLYLNRISKPIKLTGFHISLLLLKSIIYTLFGNYLVQK